MEGRVWSGTQEEAAAYYMAGCRSSVYAVVLVLLVLLTLLCYVHGILDYDTTAVVHSAVRELHAPQALIIFTGGL